MNTFHVTIVFVFLNNQTQNNWLKSEGQLNLKIRNGTKFQQRIDTNDSEL